MDQTALVDFEQKVQQWGNLRTAQESGADFLGKLYSENIPVTDAFWAYVEEDSQWMLYIATPLRDEKGLRSAAAIFRDILDKMTDDERSGLSLSDISMISPDSKEVTTLRQRYGSVTFGRGHRIARINSTAIEPIIYFLNHTPSMAGGSVANGKN